MAALSHSDPGAAKKVLRVGYPRNTVAVEDAVVRLLEARRPPRAIVLVAATRPAARFIALAHQLFPDAVFLALSFVDGHALAQALDPAIKRVVVTQVVPPLGDAVEAPPLVTEFRHALRRLGRLDAWGNTLALEGFLAGRIFLRGLERAKNCQDREAVIDGLLSLGVFDMGLGVPLYLGPREHQASHTVWPTRLNEGKVVPMTWDELARGLR
jgi:ABC-type branched-subunit amino acid transport system substrate-binding protein